MWVALVSLWSVHTDRRAQRKHIFSREHKDRISVEKLDFLWTNMEITSFF